MSNTIGSVSGGPSVAPVDVEPRARTRGGAAGEGGFAAALRNADQAEGSTGIADSTAAEALRDAARSITRGQRMVDSVVRAARNGRVFSQEELLAIQAGVYRYTQELELASKLVDKASTAVKTTLQSQQ